MKIGVVGTGNMGRALGINWAQADHHVFFGARSQQRAQEAQELAGPDALAGTNDEAAEFGDVILYSARGVHPAEVLSDTEVLDGKVVIDCNNREIPEGYAFQSVDGPGLAEVLQSQVPHARVVKAFNTMAQEVFEHQPAALADHRVSAFICGDDSQARAAVSTLARDLGLQPVDCGALRNVRLLEWLGDFIRFMIGGQQLGPYATISVNVLPAVRAPSRLGGRRGPGA